MESKGRATMSMLNQNRPTSQFSKDHSNSQSMIKLLNPWQGSIICVSNIANMNTNFPPAKPATIKIIRMTMETIVFEVPVFLSEHFGNAKLDYHIQATNAAILVKDRKSFSWTVQLSSSQDIRKSDLHPLRFEYEAHFLFENQKAFSDHFRLINQLNTQQVRKQTI